MAPLANFGDNNPPQDKLLQAVDKAFDHFGPQLKPVLLSQLDIRKGISAEAGADNVLTMPKLEKALRGIFRDSTDIILDWVFDELENRPG